MTKYNVGDKVRILNAVKIIGGTDHWNSGDEVSVTKVDARDDGSIYRLWLERVKTGSTMRSPFLHPEELRYIEKVSDKPTKNQRITTLESQVAELQAEVAALKKAQATPKFVPVTTDNIAVGDKIRVIDRSAIWINEDIRDGETYVVYGVCDAGQTLRVRDDDDYTLISDDEFHAIEKVVSE